ncbi:MAG: zinc-binding dehydrogenase [Armatimonadota bacterium]|nr:zinc-binding dehydrogenase [Armatimonadota bacterium]MDR7463065.1 zinc-binding dehydrogenase [Armatimonadota bacterium]MDR7469352.1 zinc-binding dehydrogenase [Armatimonadota bacterium]MDR7475589.1 zinc-binding dehydrogenase [Armatimonadota bacterium]
MRAAVFEGPGRPLVLTEVPTPRIGPGEILVRVAACGICHTDLHYIDHNVPTFKTPPLILGHETSGVVAEVGAEVEGFKAGDRVLLPAVLTCGRCAQCRRGRENICERMVMFGNHRDGAYAEYVVAPAKDVFPLPAEIPLEDAAIIADAISTPFHAVTVRGRVQPGDWVVVYGCGGVGLNLVQIAAAVGGRVIAVDLVEEKLALAATLGAYQTIDARAVEQPPKAIRKLTDGGADVAFEAVGTPGTISAAFDSLRRGGRLVLVGYSAAPAELNAARTMFFEMEILGSLGCRPVDYPRLIAMVQAGRLQLAPLISHRMPLAEINAGLDLLRQGRSIRALVLPAA